ncbi:MAG: hypothetical protein KME50_11210, partial [Nostoc desertorum CM1-VF14]|nr:hypothetical protein [Nostoc desertorum CM1-VF14]
GLTNSDPSITWYHRYQIHKHLETLHSKVLIPLTFKNERTYSNDFGRSSAIAEVNTAQPNIVRTINLFQYRIDMIAGK